MRTGPVEIARHQRAVAIDELYELRVFERREACIAGAGGGEGRVGIKRDHRGAGPARLGDAVIGGAAVDIDHLPRLPGHRGQRRHQPRALVAPDQHHVDRGQIGGQFGGHSITVRLAGLSPSA